MRAPCLASTAAGWQLYLNCASFVQKHRLEGLRKVPMMSWRRDRQNGSACKKMEPGAWPGSKMLPGWSRAASGRRDPPGVVGFRKDIIGDAHSFSSRHKPSVSFDTRSPHSSSRVGGICGKSRRARFFIGRKTLGMYGGSITPYRIKRCKYLLVIQSD